MNIKLVLVKYYTKNSWEPIANFWLYYSLTHLHPIYRNNIYLNKYITSVLRKPKLNIPFFVIIYNILKIQSIARYIKLFFLCTDLFINTKYIIIPNKNNPLIIIPIVNGKVVNLTINDVNKSNIG